MIYMQQPCVFVYDLYIWQGAFDMMESCGRKMHCSSHRLINAVLNLKKGTFKINTNFQQTVKIGNN